MLTTLFTNVTIHLLSIVVVVLLAVGIIDTLNKLNARLLHRVVGNHITLLIIGIGTMFHELSHALFCLIFHHKIIEINLLSYDPQATSLGYVSHQWDKTSFYQSAGNFFIGLAPLFTGLVAYFLGNELFSGYGIATPSVVHTAAGTGVVYADELPYMLMSMIHSVYRGMLQLFVIGNLKNIWFYPYVLFSITIAYAVAPSFSDLRGAFSGMLALIALIVLANVVMHVFGIHSTFLFDHLRKYTLTIVNAIGMLISCSACLLLLLVLISVSAKLFGYRNPG